MTISYHDHMALIAFIAEPEFVRIGSRLGANAFQNAETAFDEACGEYKGELLKNLRDFDFADEVIAIGGDVSREFAPYLYSPFSTISLGHNDCLSMVLVDEFSAIFQITGSTEAKIEQMSVAFLPDLETILGEERRKRCPNLKHLHEVFEDYSQQAGSDAPGFSAWNAMLADTPLMVCTRFKVGGMVTLGQGLLWQRALFGAMACEIQQTIDMLGEYVANNSHNELDINHDALDKTWCVLADTQGAAEVTLITATSNYSIAMTIVEKLHAMVLSRVYEEDQRIAQRCEKFPIPHLVDDWNRHQRPRVRSTKKKSLALADQFNSKNWYLPKNHVFSNIYSTCSMAARCMDPTMRENVSGKMRVIASMDVKPGHLPSIEKDAKKYRKRIDSELISSSAIHEVQIGKCDLSFALDDDFKKSRFRTTTTRGFLDTLTRFFEQLETQGRKFGETDFSYSSCNLIIPVPRSSATEGSTRALDPKTWFTPPVDKHLHQPVVPFQAELQKSARDDGSARIGRPLTLPKRYELRTTLRMLGVPWSVRHSLESLIREFVSCFGDPLMYDCVLDLFEPIRSLCGAIEQLAEQNQIAGKNSDRSSGTKRVMLDPDAIENLADIIGGLADALVHRTTMNRPEMEVRESTVGFRGGLNRIVAATNAPIAAAMDLFRWNVTRIDPHANQETQQHEIDPRFGAAKSVALGAKSVCLPLLLVNHLNTCPGEFSKLFRTAVIRIDVGDIFHPLEYVAGIHEIAHLIHQSMGYSLAHRQFINRNKEQQKASPDDPYLKCELRAVDYRLQEFFANVVTALFVFGTDVDLFVRHSLCSHSTRPSKKYEHALNDLVENLIRDFLIQNRIKSYRRKERSLLERWCDEQLSDREALKESTREEFHRFVDSVARFSGDCAKFNLASRESPIRSYASLRITDTLDRCASMLEEEWVRVCDLYEAYAKAHFPWSNSAIGAWENRNRLCQAIKKSFEQGNALVGHVLSREIPELGSPGEHVLFDNLILICEMIHTLMIECFQQTGFEEAKTRIYVERNRTNGGVDFANKDVHDGAEAGWGLYQFARGYVGVYCVPPKHRRYILKWQIALIKKLSDISSEQRGKVLEQLLAGLKNHSAE